MDPDLGPVAPVGITGVAPGLGGGPNYVADRLA